MWAYKSTLGYLCAKNHQNAFTVAYDKTGRVLYLNTLQTCDLGYSNAFIH